MDRGTGVGGDGGGGGIVPAMLATLAEGNTLSNLTDGKGIHLDSRHRPSFVAHSVL